jgi:hypothetical protein
VQGVRCPPTFTSTNAPKHGTAYFPGNPAFDTANNTFFNNFNSRRGLLPCTAAFDTASSRNPTTSYIAVQGERWPPTSTTSPAIPLAVLNDVVAWLTIASSTLLQTWLWSNLFVSVSNNQTSNPEVKLYQSKASRSRGAKREIVPFRKIVSDLKKRLNHLFLSLPTIWLLVRQPVIYNRGNRYTPSARLGLWFFRNTKEYSSLLIDPIKLLIDRETDTEHTQRVQ